MVWMFVCPQNSNDETLMPNVMVLRGGALGKWLGHEGGDPTNGISDLIKETPQRSLACSTAWGHSKKSAVYNPEESQGDKT